MNQPQLSRRQKALWSLLIGIIFVLEVAWIWFLVYLLLRRFRWVNTRSLIPRPAAAVVSGALRS